MTQMLCSLVDNNSLVRLVAASGLNLPLRVAFQMKRRWIAKSAGIGVRPYENDARTAECIQVFLKRVHVGEIAKEQGVIWFHAWHRIRVHTFDLAPKLRWAVFAIPPAGIQFVPHHWQTWPHVISINSFVKVKFRSTIKKN